MAENGSCITGQRHISHSHISMFKFNLNIRPCSPIWKAPFILASFWNFGLVSRLTVSHFLSSTDTYYSQHDLWVTKKSTPPIRPSTKQMSGCKIVRTLKFQQPSTLFYLIIQNLYYKNYRLMFDVFVSYLFTIAYTTPSRQCLDALNMCTTHGRGQ